MKSQEDIEILVKRMEEFLEDKRTNPKYNVGFKVALHVLDWVLENEARGDFSERADKIVAIAKGRQRRRRLPKRIVLADHFAI